MQIKYLVTGTPRSATKFMGQLFTSAGIPMGHEMFYGMPDYGVYVDDAQGESSWMAAPYVKNLKKAGSTIIHIVRDPLKVLSSLQRESDLNNEKEVVTNIFTWYKFRYLPTLLNYKGLDRYLHFYIEWNKHIEQFADYRHRIEDINENPSIVFQPLDIDISDKKLHTDTKTNSYGKIHNITLDDIKDCSLADDFLELTKTYGYPY